MTTEENTRYCEPICQDQFKLPVMAGWRPSKHGIVESQHREYPDVEDFSFTDGLAGEWPVQGSQRGHPGGISTIGAGSVDYWEVKEYQSAKSPYQIEWMVMLGV
ncbi:MAG: hypothetical protein Q9223_007829 [Gallowayella weberi]